MDEYGSFEGVVTAADVLEAIVGDASRHPAGPGGGPGGDARSSLVVDGMMPVDELKARLMPARPAGGGQLPHRGRAAAGPAAAGAESVGDKVVFAGWLFEVQSVDGRRVDRVRASREVLAEG